MCGSGTVTALLAGGRRGQDKLQALVYDILPSTTAVFSHVIGSRKLSANEQFFCWCSNSGKFVTNNSNKTRHVIYSRQQSLHQHRSFESRRNSFFFLLFFTRVDASHVYVRALALGCFYSHISTGTFRGALTASVDGQLRGDKECPFSGVTKSGRVWRKVPESDAGSVGTGRPTPTAKCSRRTARRPEPESRMPVCSLGSLRQVGITFRFSDPPPGPNPEYNINVFVLPPSWLLCVRVFVNVCYR